MEITKNMEEFILFWGEMGARWGVNRYKDMVTVPCPVLCTLMKLGVKIVRFIK